MNYKLKVIGLVLIAIGVAIIGILDFINHPETPEVATPEVMRPTTTETITTENVTDGFILKKFTHGDTVIDYAVIVENGVEATPLPSVMEAMQNSYTPGEQKMIADFTKTIIFDRYGKFKETFLENQMYYSLTNHQKLKQEYIDKTFSCDNYGQLAEKFDRFSLAGHGYSGTAENYIYTRAVNDCLDPKHQEEIDKVYAELDEVNKSNDKIQ